MPELESLRCEVMFPAKGKEAYRDNYSIVWEKRR